MEKARVNKKALLRELEEVRETFKVRSEKVRTLIESGAIAKMAEPDFERVMAELDAAKNRLQALNRELEG